MSLPSDLCGVKVACKPEVSGSIPSGGKIILHIYFLYLLVAPVALYVRKSGRSIRAPILFHCSGKF